MGIALVPLIAGVAAAAAGAQLLPVGEPPSAPAVTHAAPSMPASAPPASASPAAMPEADSPTVLLQSVGFNDPAGRWSLLPLPGWEITPAEHVAPGVFCLYPDVSHGELTLSSASGRAVASLPDPLPEQILDRVFPDMTAAGDPVRIDSPYWDAVMRVYQSNRSEGPQRHLGLVARRGDVIVLITANDQHVALPRRVEHFAHVMACLRIQSPEPAR